MYASRLAFQGLCRSGVSPKLSHQVLFRSQGYATQSGRTGLRRLRSNVGTSTAPSGAATGKFNICGETMNNK